MAAASDSPLPQLVDLRQMRAGDLNALLEEETRVWERLFHWDFRASASLVRRFLDMQALSGHTLVLNGRAIGYSYFVCEERKGLIGDIYVMDAFANQENEGILLDAIFESLLQVPGLRRVESQLLMLRHWSTLRMPYAQFLKTFPRQYMERDLSDASTLRPRALDDRFLIDTWTEKRQDDAAALIATAYRGHVDSEINDQYRSPGGARRFLLNIVQYPGCGVFFQPASFVAIDRSTGRVCGINLCSLINADVGHITQVCVSPVLKGLGLGYELIRRSLASLESHACSKASLTVTTANVEAVQLYESMHFHKAREFAAFVWDGF